jgi:hypothetical protein
MDKDRDSDRDTHQGGEISGGTNKHRNKRAEKKNENGCRGCGVYCRTRAGAVSWEGAGHEVLEVDIRGGREGGQHRGREPGQGAPGEGVADGEAGQVADQRRPTKGIVEKEGI